MDSGVSPTSGAVYRSAVSVLIGGVAAACLLLLGLVLRHRREAGSHRTSSGRGSAAALLRAGMLESQSLLEPERKVEILKLDEKRDLDAAIERAGKMPTPPDDGR